MASDHERPDDEAERTVVLPRVPAGSPPQEGDAERTDRIADTPIGTGETMVGAGFGGSMWSWPDPGPAGSGPAAPPPSAASGRTMMLRRAGLVAACVVGAFLLLYTVDLLASQGSVPRGVVIAGTNVGGMSRAAAEQRLREQIGPRLTRPVRVKAGDAVETVDPVGAGLSVDWPATFDRAGDQPLNPFTRFASFFTSRDVDVASKANNTKLTAAVQSVGAKVDRAPTEGTVRFQGITPVAVEPKAGQRLDPQGAAHALLDNWADGVPVQLPVDEAPVRTTSQGVHQALDTVAKPAVSNPVVVRGEGRDALLDPNAIATALTFEPGEGGGLAPKVDQQKVVGALKPQLAPSEREAKDAQIVFNTGRPSVQPSVDGHGVDWDKSLVGLMDTLKRPDGRVLTAEYANAPAKVTTDMANQLGITDVIGEFTTGGFAADSGANIHTVADKVNGAIVKPGDTFSLNGFTGPRTPAQGYVEAGVIEHGAPAREVGGGISQFATTLYNASYFAAMTDAGHKEHSYYINRYPPAREATVFQNPDGSSVIDVKFKNDNPTGVAVQTIWTPQSITVRLWGTRRYTVESIPGQRRDFTPPNTVTQPPGPFCHAGEGAPGFTTDDTRVIRDLSGREVRRDVHTVKYDPQPKIICGGPPPPPPRR